MGMFDFLLKSKDMFGELGDAILSGAKLKGGAKAAKVAEEAWEPIKAMDWKHNAEGKLGLSDIFKGALSDSPISRNVAWGAGALGATAMLGSAFYGTASIGMPNNAEMYNPFKNVGKAVGVGMAGGALLAASRGLGAAELTKFVKPELAERFAGIQNVAKMTTGALENRLVIGAIGAATLAGSGDLNLTKPVNPVY